MTYDPAIPLLALYPNKMKLVGSQEIYTPVFTGALFITANK